MEKEKIKVLYVEDNPIDRLGFARFVLEEGLPYWPVEAGSIAQGRERLAREQFDLVLLDFSLKDGTAFDLIAEVPNYVPVVIVTGIGNEEVAVQAMKHGAADYLVKDPDSNWLKTVPFTFHNAIKSKQAEEDLKRAYAELETKVEERTAELQVANTEMRREISQRMIAENALRESEERFRALTETTSEWIWEMDTEGVITYASPRVEDLLGYTRGETIGKSRFSFVLATEASEIAKKYKEYVALGKPFRNLETLNVHKDSRLVMLLSSGVPFFDDMGDLAGYRGIDLDITERKRAEELLIRSERIKAVADLAAGVAHNFNNLLQIVVFGIETVLHAIQGGNLSLSTSVLKKILDRSGQGAETVKMLLDFARCTVDDSHAEGETFSLSQTVKHAVEMSRPWWKSGPEKEGIQISVDVKTFDECPVLGKENEIFEVVINLIRNAAEALPSGGTITVSTYIAGNKAILKVADDGIGIPQANLGRVFEPFFTTKGAQGTGLGLASSYGIVLRHGGNISVESKEGRGTEFKLEFPVAEVSLVADREALTDFPWRLSILVIEDEPIMVDLLKIRLQSRGQIVLTAQTGKQGIEIFENESPDIVLSDLSMPDMNGKEVARHIKESCEQRGVPKPPFLLVTGWMTESIDEKSLAEYGIDRVLTKPVETESLLNAIRGVISKRELDGMADNGTQK